MSEQQQAPAFDSSMLEFAQLLLHDARSEEAIQKLTPGQWDRLAVTMAESFQEVVTMAIQHPEIVLCDSVIDGSATG